MKTRPGVNGKAKRVVAAYLRVSSRSQTLAMQHDAIERAAGARGDHVVNWYCDRFTGGAQHPPELIKVLDIARRGHLGKLYVYRLDRLGRRGIRDLLGIVHELEQAGVELVTISDGFDLHGPARDVVLAVLAWAAQMERAAIAERIASARQRVEANGGKWGRPRRMTEEQVTQARALKAKGRSNRSIAAALGISLATISRAVIQKPGQKWGPRAIAKAKLRRLRKQGHSVDLRKTKADRLPGASQ